MDFKISLAGVTIGVQSIYDEVYRLCKDYLTEDCAAFAVAITPERIAYEREKSIREALHEHRQPELFPEPYLETLAVYRAIVEKLLDYDVLLMHGSAVAANGQAFLFTAPSGVGKTTHTRLWLQNVPDAFVVNGDKPLLRFRGGSVEVCGTPWSGKEGMNTNAAVPLRAICVLERGAVNKIEPLPFIDCYATLLQQSYRPTDAASLQKTMTLIRKLGEAVKLYRLKCNMDPDAAIVAYNAMKE